MNVSKLRAKMSEERYSQRLLAKKIGMPIATFSSKLNGKTKFKISEAVAVCDALNIPRVNIFDYFVV